MPGTLFLIPTPLANTPLPQVLPEATREITARLTHFVVENAKTARAFLKQVGTATPLQQLHLVELSEHTPASALPDLLAPLLAGYDVGVLSEAGCPAIADPGAPLARLAHARGITVVPLVGPSSILLALMGSGLVGQRFTFHGYLPAKPEARKAALLDLEKRARRDQAAQVFIETPYRNDAMLEAIVEICAPQTLLCLACDLTLPDQLLQTRAIADWKHARPTLGKRPCVFVLQA